MSLLERDLVAVLVKHKCVPYIDDGLFIIRPMLPTDNKDYCYIKFLPERRPS